MLAVTKGSGTVSLWDVATGKEISSWRAHTTIAKGLCFSPDGKQLATTSHAHDPKLWDVKTGSLIATLER
jgi:WD40 repeat protein